jgi:hypothetical protein
VDLAKPLATGGPVGISAGVQPPGTAATEARAATGVGQFYCGFGTSVLEPKDIVTLGSNGKRT